MTIEEYLTNHSLNEEFAKKIFLWEWDAEKITIPIFDADKKFLYNRYRHLTGPNKFSTDKGSHPVLYAVHLIKEKESVVLCEGEPDCVRLWQEKIPAITGTSGVKTFNPKMAEPLKGKKVLIVLDTDEEGQTSLEKYYRVLAEAGAKPFIKELPAQYKDVSEFFTAGFTKADFDKLPEMTLEDWQDAHEPETFGWESAAELLARDIPQNKWLVDRILPKQGFCFIVGPEASGKSFDALTLAQSVASGKPWLDKFEVTQKCPVLILDKENTKKRTQDRLKGLGVTDEPVYFLKAPHYLEMADEERDSGFTAFMDSVARRVKKLGIGLIILDSFTDFLIGNENDRADVQKFFDAMRQLFPDIAILVLHHAAKPAPGVVRTMSQRARGSTNIMAQTYSAFHTEPLPKSKTEFTIEQTKAGDAEKLPKFLIELKVVPNPDQEGDTLVSGIEYKGEVQDKEEKAAEAAALIEEAFLETNSIPRNDLKDAIMAEGVSGPTFDRAIKQLKEAGKIDSVRRGKFTDYMWIGKKDSGYEIVED